MPLAHFILNSNVHRGHERVNKDVDCWATLSQIEAPSIYTEII